MTKQIIVRSLGVQNVTSFFILPRGKGERECFEEHRHLVIAIVRGRAFANLADVTETRTKDIHLIGKLPRITKRLGSIMSSSVIEQHIIMTSLGV